MSHASRSRITVNQARMPGTLGCLGGEASLNWLALGLLLAAWNAAADDGTNAPHGAANQPPRPEVLRGHSYISVRPCAGWLASADRAWRRHSIVMSRL